MRDYTDPKLPSGLWVTLRKIGPVMKRFLLLLAIVLSILAPTPGRADDVVPEAWVDFDPHFYLAEKWEFYGQSGAQYQWDWPAWGTLYVRPSIRMHPPGKSAWEYHGGLGVYYRVNTVVSNTLELRPWLGLLLKRPRLGRVTLTNYLRLEERIIDTLNNGSWSASRRLRYRIRIKLPLSRIGLEKHLYAPLSVEWFFDLGGNAKNIYADQLRIQAGAGHFLDNNWTAEFSLTLQTSRNTKQEQFSPQELVFRLQVKYLWSSHDYMSR